MKALITGGTGFLGANLVKGLTESGHEARILKRPTSQMDALEGLVFKEAVGDILDEKSLMKAMDGCDWVFHVAAVSDYWRQGVDWLYRVNIEGTKTVLRAAQATGVKRLVYTSSAAALGVSTDGQPMDETNTFNISPRRFPYGHTKHLAELEVQQAIRAGLDAVIVNPAVVIGPRDINKVSGSLVIEVARGLVRFYLPGGVNYVAVEDVVAGHIAAAEKGRTGERYILGGHNIPHREAIDVIVQVTNGPRPLFTVPFWAIEPIAIGVAAARKVFGNRIPINSNQVRMSGQRLYFNTDKAVRELEMPQTPFRTAVERAFRWFKDNGHLK
ncbi:MAG: SDR family oxidoreductase [Anaerolineales bacterium]|nr:SDR family oxidoreductase [Anaerolineales bacterium]